MECETPLILLRRASLEPIILYWTSFYRNSQKEGDLDDVSKIRLELIISI